MKMKAYPLQPFAAACSAGAPWLVPGGSGNPVSNSVAAEGWRSYAPCDEVGTKITGRSLNMREPSVRSPIKYMTSSPGPCPR